MPLTPLQRARLMAIRGISSPLLSRVYGKIAESRLPSPVVQALIRRYIRKFNVRTDEVKKELHEFESMDAFFTRRLRDGAREISQDPEHLLASADGKLLAPGPIERGLLIQAKGHDYSLADLLGNPGLAEQLEGGFAYTIYLSPQDYHRVHMPMEGDVLGYRYIPGSLFPVFPFARENISQLFCRNERVVVRISTASGMAAVVFVGATFVGKISLSFAPLRTNTGAGGADEVVLEEPVHLEAGADLGAFHMGSTVVVLHEAAFDPTPGCIDDTGIKMGAPVASLKASSPGENAEIADRS